jgi:predicted deacylase
LQARHGRTWALDSSQTAVERYRLTRPWLFGQKELTAADAEERLRHNDTVHIERTLEVSFGQENRLRRRQLEPLKSAQDLEAYVGRYGHEGAPRDIYQVEVQGKKGWVDPSAYAQASFLDGDANFLITEEEILAETTPSKLSYERSGLLDFQYHTLTHEIPSQISEYPSYEQVSSQMKALEQTYPGQVERVSLGHSAEGRPIWALRIGHGQKEALLTGLTHAREWASGQVPMQIAERTLAEKSPLLDDLTLWVVPVVNPDGYENSRNQDPGQRGNSASVDLNRNYPTEWRLAGDTPESTRDDKGGSDKIGSPTYRGQAPLSEPETQAIDRLIQSRPNLRGWLDYHGYGRLLIYPASQRPQAYQEILQGMQGQLAVPYSIEGIQQYGEVTGSALQHGESLGIMTVTMEIGQAFQPAGAAHQQTLQEGFSAGLEFLYRIARQSSPA